MSDTPRTNDATWHQRIPGNPVGADVTAASFSAGLERELAAAQNQIGLLISGAKKDERTIRFLTERIQRLVEAGDEVFWAIGTASVTMMTERERVALKGWTAAKEEKQ